MPTERDVGETPPVAIARTLAEEAGRCTFGPPVAHVYNPLDYAFDAHRQYLERYCRREADILLVGMNPGPWGMVQTGVPFGDVAFVRDWLGISAGVTTPAEQHPKRPIEGFACPRSEVSGQRVWGWAQERFGTPDAFFRRFFIWNHCPLAFLEESGRNRTPNHLPAAERKALYDVCDRALAKVVDYLEPSLVLGIGRYAEARCHDALRPGTRIDNILHPSPANPAANKGWVEQMERQLAALGVSLP